MQDEAMAKTMGVSTDLSEDCLFLNVWTPAKSNKDKLAVIVWIHDGGFTSGTTCIPMYNGINFANTGDPNGPGMIKWPVFTKKDKKVMVLDQDSSARPIPNLEMLEAFDEYYAWRREEVKVISAK